MARRPSLIPGPNINYASAGAAKAQASASLGAELDRMSGFVFKEAAERAAVAGAQYGFDKPITVEQIEDAMREDRGIDEIVGDQTTIFGSASRATIGQKLQAQLEAESRSKIAVIQGAISAGQPVDLDSVRSTLNGLMDGNSSVLAEIDPKLASQYRATVSTVAASTFKLATEQVFKAQKREALAIYDSGKIILPDNIGSLLASETEENFYAQEAVLRRSHMDLAFTTGDATTVKSAPTDFDTAKAQAATGLLVELAREDVNAVDERNGNFGEKSWIWNSLSSAEKADVASRIRTIRDDDHTSKERADKEVLANAKEQVVFLVSSLSEMSADDPNRGVLEAQLTAFQAAGLVSATSYKGALDGRLPPSNSTEFADARLKVADGTLIDNVALAKYLEGKEINDADKASLYNALIAKKSQLYNIALGIIRPLVDLDQTVSSDRKPIVATMFAIEAVESASESNRDVAQVAQEMAAKQQVAQLKAAAEKAIEKLNMDVDGWRDEGFESLSVENFSNIAAFEARITEIKNTDFYNGAGRDGQASINRHLSSLLRAYKALYELGAAGAAQ